jgi:hypothetical protein
MARGLWGASYPQTLPALSLWLTANHLRLFYSSRLWLIQDNSPELLTLFLPTFQEVDSSNY